jgi:alkylated DNA repair dioxygenase AlkB
MDHFRISYIWAEKSVRGKAFYKVRFDKIVRSKAWWTPNQPEPPMVRYPSPPLLQSPCIFCNTPAPQIYAETWLCTNPSCAFFWHTKDGSEVPNNLTLDRKFLMQRLPEIQWFKPGFELVPDLMSNLLTLRETGQITAALRSLWRGIVCPQCRKCNPRILWNVWTCDNCDIDYPPDPGYIELQSIITRTSVSYIGHPVIAPEWPKNDFAYHGPFFRQHYRVERWILHENSSVTLISPTSSFNEETNGPNTLWDEMLASANLGNLGLRRGLLRRDGLRTRHFFNHFGAEYDMSDVPSTPLDEAPQCVAQSVGLLNQVGQAELGQLYEWPNQVSVNGYWSEMGLTWHADGEDEIGSTISTLSLGGDAIMHIRLQMAYYHNEIDMMNEDPITGSLEWRNLTELRRRWEAGEIEDEDYKINPEVLAGAISKMRPQIDLPLIHGSIVIMTGKALTKYYEVREL